jgi:hypothetical protein
MYVEYALIHHGRRILLVESSSLPKFDATKLFYSKFGFHQDERIGELYTGGEDMILLWKLTESPTILLRRCISTRTETAILDFETICGLLANLALGENVEEIRQRYGKVDENLQGLDSDEKGNASPDGKYSERHS